MKRLSKVNIANIGPRGDAKVSNFAMFKITPTSFALSDSVTNKFLENC